MADEPVEDGLGPGGRSAKLFQHHGVVTCCKLS